MAYRLFIFIYLLTLPCGSFGARQVTIDDFSRLNQTLIQEIVAPQTYTQLAGLLHKANQEKIPVSIAGIRHSQGGHTFYPNGIVITLNKLNNIMSFDPTQKLLTVQTGITWKEIQEYLNPHNLAVKVMQFANIFTVGGALSVNCNGIDPHYGPLIESVRSIKIMVADGSIVHASRTENAELFRLAIGGYGLYGIILEATLEVTDNSLYKKETTTCTLEEYVQFIKQHIHDDSVGFHFAQFNLHPRGKRLLPSLKSFVYRPVDERTLSTKKKARARTLKKERFVQLKKWGIWFLRRSAFMKSKQVDADAIPNHRIVSRNTIMSPHVSHLHCDLTSETDLLQEYFIPVDNLIPFINQLESVTKTYHVNILHVALRFIPKNTESFLSYTTHDCIGVIILLSQKQTSTASARTKQWTQSLIDAAIKAGGTYYLPIQLHADKTQLNAAYPQIDQFFTLKRQYDPHELFLNCFYKRYA